MAYEFSKICLNSERNTQRHFH